MRYVAIAAGYDGTLARDGTCDPRCVEALRSLAATGRKLILVTARELRELLETFPEARVFDYVIAENGAVLHRLAARQSEILGQAPSEILLQELQRRGVQPLNVGSSIITTTLTNLEAVREAIERLHLDYQLVRNERSLIILPAEVDKATGVQEALRDLAISAHNLVCIGDAQNDAALFELAECRVAVANADEQLKQSADRVTQGAYCEGFLEFAQHLLARDLVDVPARFVLPLGYDQDGHDHAVLSPYADSLLVVGRPGAGKTAFCNHILQFFLDRAYQCCVIGAGLTVAPGTQAFGDTHEVPRLTDVLAALEKPDMSVSVDLAALSVETRPVFVDALLVQLQALHDRLGLPHCILVHDAERFFSANGSASARSAEITKVYTTAEPQLLPAEIVESVHWTLMMDDSADFDAAWAQSRRRRVLQVCDGPAARAIVAFERSLAGHSSSSNAGYAIAAGMVRDTSPLGPCPSDCAEASSVDPEVSVASG